MGVINRGPVDELPSLLLYTISCPDLPPVRLYCVLTIFLCVRDGVFIILSSFPQRTVSQLVVQYVRSFLFFLEIGRAHV